MANCVSVLPALPQQEAGNVSSLSPAAFFKPPQPASEMFQIPQSPSSSLVSSCKKQEGRQTIKEKEKTQTTEREWSQTEIRVMIELILFLHCGFVFQCPTACGVCKRSAWCLYVIIKDVFCLSFVVEVCFVFSVLATYPVSVSK